MKRPLNKTEKILTKKGIEKRNNEVKESKEAIEIHNLHMDFIKAKRKYEAKLEPYNRKVEDINFKTKIEKFKLDLKVATEDLKNLKDQLKNGIEVKEAPGVS